MTVASWLRLTARETRGSAGRLLFFAACLAVGVAAVVAVAGLSQALDETIQARARQLLAADVTVSSRRPIPDAVAAAVAGLPEARTTTVRELPSVVSVPAAEGGAGNSLLCELKAVGDGYPFYGSLVTEPMRPLDELLGVDRVLVGRELLARLEVSIGDTLRIGSALYRVAGVVDDEPDRLDVSFALGPRILLSQDGLERSELTGTGSRVEQRLLVALPGGSSTAEVEVAAEVIRAAVADPAFVRIETYVEAQPTLRRGLERVGRFLGLVALLSLLVGGIGVAQAVRAWLQSRLDSIAVLRSLGVRPREIFALYLGQTVVLAAVGSAAGAVLGAVVARAVPGVLSGILPVAVEVGWQPAAMLRGVVLGLVVAALFALRPLVDVLRVPPVRVLRRDAEPLPVSRGVAFGLALVLAIGIAAVAAVQSASLIRGLQFTAGILVAAAVLAGGAWLVMRAVAVMPRDVGVVALRHGLAALARPGSGTLGGVVALGLGVLTVLGMYLVQERLAAQLDADLPDEAPTVFLIDIQPPQWDGVRRALENAGAESLQSVEVVMARLQAVNGVPVAELAAGVQGDRRWVLTREQRLTSMAELPEDNVILEGALWSDPARDEVSIERDFAADLGVGVGDRLTFNIQGVPFDLYVSSLRSVEWERFSINFFLVVEPGVLDRAPRFRIAAARLAEDAEQPLLDRLAATYPNVTALKLREVLEKVVAILQQVGFGVRMVGGFTVLAGIAILGGAVSAGAVRRGRQVALYKTLGMTRAQVVAVFAAEYALVSAVAGTIGTFGGAVMAWLVTRYGFEMTWEWSPVALAAAVLGTVVLGVTAGLAASVRALAVRPLAVLRQVD